MFYVVMNVNSYSIDKIDNLIVVSQSGEWNLATDIEYLAKLNDIFMSMRPHSFYVFVDMRGWQVPDSVKNTRIKETLRMDRRSQIGECWLTDNLDMSSYILTHFEQFDFELTRLTDPKKALDWVSSKVPNKQNLDPFLNWFGSK